MILKDNEYCVCGECIAIHKEVLEEWRDHFRDLAKMKEDGFLRGYCLGKADILVNLLKLFEKEI